MSAFFPNCPSPYFSRHVAKGSAVFDLIPLGSLRAGQRALVAQVVGQADHVHRLEELGIRDGASVEMLQTGTPCIVQLAGNKLCFRGGETMSILVRMGSEG